MAAGNLEKNRSMWRTELAGTNLSNSRKFALNNVKADVDRQVLVVEKQKEELKAEIDGLRRREDLVRKMLKQAQMY